MILERLKRAAAIHDLSGFGKCSLTVILPIMSSMGVETCAIPTAVLSSHTGGLPGYVSQDLTSLMIPFARQWKDLGISFDALYSGYLATPEQADSVMEIFGLLRSEGTLTAVDPVMADNGKFYSNCTPELLREMRHLCGAADLILPNLTEAAFLLEEPYQEGPGSREIWETLLKKLTALGPSQAVLTGVWRSPEEIGAVGYDRRTGGFCQWFVPRVEGRYHGTGDAFASVMISALLRGMTMQRSLELAVEFTRRIIARTHSAGTDPRYGVLFEPELPFLSGIFQ